MRVIHWTGFRQDASVALQPGDVAVVMIYHKSGCSMNKICRYCNYVMSYQESLMICSWISRKNSTNSTAIITYIDFDMRCFRSSIGYTVAVVRAPSSRSLEKLAADIDLEKCDHRVTLPYSCGSNADYLR